MDPLSAAASVTVILQLAGTILRYPYTTSFSLRSYTILYGVAGPVIWGFGSRGVWTLEAKVLASTEEKDATGFRKAMQRERNMTTVAVGVLRLVS